MLSLDTLAFVYEPYPIGLAQRVFADDVYTRLVESFPPRDLFEYKQALGHKYSLSEVSHPDRYHAFIHRHESWSAFHRWIKRKQFPYEILDILRARHVDLGLRRSSSAVRDRARRLVDAIRGVGVGSAAPLSARFEFSMLPAAGGCIKPHTDHPRKIVTLVLAMCAPAEWPPAFEGGTDVMRPRDITRNYNFVNAQLEFDEVEVLRTFAYEPNQCLVFVKTFNSLHAVRPMPGEGSGLMRKTLTVNIEQAAGRAF